MGSVGEGVREHAKLFAECIRKMADVGVANLKRGLADVAVAVREQIVGLLEALGADELVDGLAVNLLEEAFHLAVVHLNHARELVERRRRVEAFEQNVACVLQAFAIGAAAGWRGVVCAVAGEMGDVDGEELEDVAFEHEPVESAFAVSEQRADFMQEPRLADIVAKMMIGMGGVAQRAKMQRARPVAARQRASKLSGVIQRE